MTPEQKAYVSIGTTTSQRKDLAHELFEQEWEKANRRGTFEGATGTGKTKAALRLIANQFRKNPGSYVLIAVPTETLRDVDWPDEFRKWGYEHLLPKVVLTCWVSLSKVVVPGDVDLFVGDEWHHLTVANAAFFDRVKVWDICALTATLPKGTKSIEDGNKRALLDSLAPSVFKISLEEGIELGLIADFAVKTLLFDLDSADMYINASNAGKKPSYTTEASRYLQLTKTLQKMAWQKKEGAKFIFIQKRTALLRNLRSAEKYAKKLMEILIEPGNRTLIFCSSIEQCNKLCGINVYHSGTDETALQSFQQGGTNYLGCVDALNEGKNVVDLDQSLMTGVKSVDRILVQQIGRNIRWRENHKALITVLVPKATAAEKWYREAFADFDKARIEEYHIKWKDKEETELEFTRLKLPTKW